MKPEIHFVPDIILNPHYSSATGGVLRAKITLPVNVHVPEIFVDSEKVVTTSMITEMMAEEGYHRFPSSNNSIIFGALDIYEAVKCFNLLNELVRERDRSLEDKRIPEYSPILIDDLRGVDFSHNVGIENSILNGVFERTLKVNSLKYKNYGLTASDYERMNNRLNTLIGVSDSNYFNNGILEIDVSGDTLSKISVIRDSLSNPDICTISVPVQNFTNDVVSTINKEVIRHLNYETEAGIEYKQRLLKAGIIDIPELQGQVSEVKPDSLSVQIL